MARDIDEQHKGQLGKLRLVAGSFPKQAVVEKLESLVGGEHKYEAIFAANMIHFLDSANLQQAFTVFFKLLNHGGHLFITATTPFVKWLKTEVNEWVGPLRWSMMSEVFLISRTETE